MFGRVLRRQLSAGSDATSVDIIIIGGGIAGVLSALECARDGRQIYIFEQLPEILQGTSRNQCYRLHTGMHYPDPEFITSVKCLFDTVASLKRLPPRCIHMQTSRYYLMSNSLYNQPHMEQTARLLQTAYRELIAQDHSNKLLGEPDELVRFLKPEEYQSYIAPTVRFVNRDSSAENARIVFAVDIIEPQIKIDKLRAYLLARLAETPNVHLLTRHRVRLVRQRDDDFGYTVKVVSQDDPVGRERTFLCDAIVNCSWEETENLNPPDFTQYFPSDVRNCMKASLLVRLSEAFVSQRIPSSLFCYGPHAALSVLEDGTGVMTWEPATNVGSWMSGEEPSEVVKNILRDGARLEDGAGKEIAASILKGFARYIPCLQGATPIDLRIGYVRTPVQPVEKTDFSIYDKNSSIHLRRASGVVPLMQIFGSCYVINEARKFTYGICNAAKVGQLIRAELEHMESWRRSIASLHKPGEEFSFSEFRAAMNTINLMFYTALGAVDGKMLPYVIAALGIMNGGQQLVRHQIDAMAKYIGDVKEQQAEEEKIRNLIGRLSHKEDESLPGAAADMAVPPMDGIPVTRDRVQERIAHITHILAERLAGNTTHTLERIEEDGIWLIRGHERMEGQLQVNVDEQRIAFFYEGGYVALPEAGTFMALFTRSSALSLRV